MYLARPLSALAEVPAAEWNALLGPAAPPFLDWRFLAALEEAGCVGSDSGWLPQHLTLWLGDRLVAAAPAYVKLHSMGEFVFDHSWAELGRRLGIAYYPKLVIAVPFTPATGPRFLTAPGEERAPLVAALGEAARRLCDALELSSAHALFCAPDEVAALAEVGFGERLGIQFHWTNRGYTCFEDFLARMPSKKRTQLRREMAEPERAGIELATLRGAELTPEVLSAMYDFYLATVDKFTWGQRYLTREFFLRVGSDLREHVEVVLARERGRPLAGAFNLAKGDRLYGRYWGARAERKFLHFNVCYYHSIAECIARGVAVFEPGAGGEHKLVRGFDPVLTRSAHYLRDPRLAGPIRSYLPREAAELRRRAELLAAASPLRT